MKRHVFLTGELQCGKSTLIRAVLTKLAQEFGGVPLRVGGFRTFFFPKPLSREHKASDNLQLYIAPYRLADFLKIHAGLPNDALKVADNIPAAPHIFTQAFNDFGASLLQGKHEADKNNWDILIMDECGRFEAEADQFTEAVKSSLERAIPVLGVIRQLSFPSWLDSLKTNKNVSLITLTEKNRLDTAAQLIEHFRKSIRC